MVRYGPTTAVDGLSLTAHHGQVLALLGPNGAGKTSTVETLEGYRRATEGSVRVLGLDPVSDHRRVVARMGVMLQRGGVYPVMGPRRALGLFADYYDDPEDPDALLELVGLGAVARTPWRRLSGGEQQRLSLALAIVGRPEVVFLDEPTAGVDPEGRMAVRRVITELRDRGACVMLTTHELAEAERVADDVVIIAHGRTVAEGTVAELAAAGGEGGIRFEGPAALDLTGLSRRAGHRSGHGDRGAPRRVPRRRPRHRHPVGAVGAVDGRPRPSPHRAPGRASVPRGDLPAGDTGRDVTPEEIGEEV